MSASLTSTDIRSRYLEFFKKRGHAILPSAPLVPENDPTTLFNTAGMQPLIPYLLGEKHPLGTRLADCQKCVRTGDIDDVGDNRHLTFFEMLGNWSLGDYFKKEAIEWSFEFITSKEEGLGLDPERLYVTVFKGENGIPRDEEAITVWQNVFKKHALSSEVAGDDGVMKKYVRIIPLGVNDNFWIAGATGPCGGDTEMFYDTRPEDGELKGTFSSNVDSFRLIEIWNDVFMEFNKTAEGKYEPLAKKNVDTGMGLERTTVVVNGKSTVFETDCFTDLLAVAGKATSDPRGQRIIADHMRSAVFMIADGVTPSNTDRGYILRRLIRRAAFKSEGHIFTGVQIVSLVEAIALKYARVYPEIEKKKKDIARIIEEEIGKFSTTVSQGVREFEKLSTKKTISGKEAFILFSTYGFPFEMTQELALEKKHTVDEAEFKEELKKHQDLSRIGAEKKFKGGMGDTTETSVKYHTTTHLLNAALRQVLGSHVGQKGSNITPERLRFDFSHSEKMTDEQKKQVEDIVNNWIKADLPVTFQEIPKTEAEKIAIHVFGDRYGDIVRVYSIGDEKKGYISREFCGGPHVEHLGVLGHFKIQKEEAVAQGIRRIKAILE